MDNMSWEAFEQEINCFPLRRASPTHSSYSVGHHAPEITNTEQWSLLALVAHFRGGLALSNPEQH